MARKKSLRTSRVKKRRAKRSTTKKSRTKRSAKRSTKRNAKRSTTKKSRAKRSAKRSATKKTCDAKWKTLEHNGVVFPPDYEYLSIPLLYGIDKKQILLNKDAEEAAMFYAKILHLDHSANPIFRKNFFNDWKKLLPRNSEIKKLEECDFSNFRLVIEKEAAEKKALTKSKKQRIKDDKEISEAKYKTAIVDGKKQPVGNFRIEPPGLFLGRGKHPKAGKIKQRVKPEDVIINIGKKAPVPKPPDGHEWGQVVHDNCSVWLASWKESINNDTKYVWLGQDADIKANSDEAKFELARELKNNFDKIRKDNEQNIMVIGSSKESDKLNQLATAVYLIDNLVLRVGNEKGSDEADTVGVASLRVEHIKLHPNNMVELDFLGKDSVRFHKKFEVLSIVTKLLKYFISGKLKSQPLFDLINAKDINQYLKHLMPGLTAKVFRTANASDLFQNELDKIKVKRNEKPAVLIAKMNKANAQVAIMCNHKKKVARGFNIALEKMQNNIKEVEAKIKELKKKDGARKRSKTVEKQIKTKKEKLKELKAKLDTKKHMKDIATGTSKINYIDPRITVAFAKKHSIDISKVFNKQQQAKFAWAMDVGPRWKF